MKKRSILMLITPLLYTQSLFAEVSKPIEVASRPSAHCQGPIWAPNGQLIAVNIYEPKAESREVWEVKLSPQYSNICLLYTSPSPRD